MTILGKMMAIFVLILSILQGALTVALFSSRAHWSNQLKEVKAQNEVTKTSASQFQVELEQAKNDANNREAALNAKVMKLDADYKQLLQTNAGLQTQVSDEVKKTMAAESASRQAIGDVKTRQVDNDRMIVVLRERDTQIAKLVTDNKKEREDRVNAEIAQRVLQQTNEKLEERLRDAMREIVKRNQSTGSTTTVRPNAPNPPAENVEGLVSDIDNSGLMEITIGSDAGLKVGNTLEVYRIAAVPSQSQYLGMVRIRSVTANKAVAEPVGRMSDKVQKNDRVGSRIGG